MNIFKQLTFDTALFGKKIAASFYQKKADWKTIKLLMGEDKTDLLYLNATNEIPIITIERCLNCYVSYCDEKVIFEKKLMQNNNQEAINHIQTNLWSNCDVAQLELLALDSSQYSRFFRDTKISNEHAKELYLLWINKSLTFELADDIYIFNNGSKASGLLTVKFDGVTATVGLLAVSSEYRGQGIALNLMKHMENRCIEKGIDTVFIPTQRINKIACDFYHKASYHETSSSFIYHCWKKYG